MSEARRTLVALLAVSALGAVATPAQADAPTLQGALGNPEGLTVSGSVRVRYEAIGGQLRAGLDREEELLAIKSTLLVEYKDGPWRIGGELADSRTYLGSADGSVTSNDVNTFEPIQAYVGLDLKDALGKGTRASLQAGRFSMNLGSQRFLSSDQYRNAPGSYTGVRADLKAADGTSATLFYVLPQIHLPDDAASVLANKTAFDRESFDLQLFGGLISHPKTVAGASAELGYYRLLEKDWHGHPTRDRNLHTFTARLLREPKAGKLDFEVEGAWQLGRISTSAAANAPTEALDAGLVHASVGYLFPGHAKAHVTLAYDWVSGDRPGGSYNRFDTLFGMRRAEWGPSGLFSAIGRANITGPSVRFEVAPGKRFDAMVLYRAMWLASRTDAFSTTGVVDKTGASGSFAGHQVDTRLRYWLVPGFLRAEANFDWIAKGRFLKTAPNAPATGNTRYGAFGLTATF